MTAWLKKRWSLGVPATIALLFFVRQNTRMSTSDAFLSAIRIGDVGRWEILSFKKKGGNIILKLEEVVSFWSQRPESDCQKLTVTLLPSHIRENLRFEVGYFIRLEALNGMVAKNANPRDPASYLRVVKTWRGVRYDPV